MSRLEKADLLGPIVLETDEVKITRGEVLVRALTRFEAGLVEKREDTDARDRLTITLGLVDPKLEESEVGAWMKSDKASDLIAVAKRIAELSGLLAASGTEAYKSDGDGSEPGV